MTAESESKAFNRRQVKTLRRMNREHHAVDIVAVANMKERRFRRQAGQLKQYSDGWYCRYYKDDERIDKRIRVAVPLGIPAGDEHKLEALNAFKRKMNEVNSEGKRHIEIAQGELDDMTVATFADTEWLPFIYEPGNLMRSTAEIYKKEFEGYIRAGIGSITLKNFRPAHGKLFLQEMVKKGLGRNMVSHIKNVCSSLFSRAVDCEQIDTNPIRDIHVRVKKAPRPKRQYTVEERDAILGLKTLTTEAKVYFALISVAAMRPGEAAAMDWSNVDFKNEEMHIRGAVTGRHGRLGPTKTERSMRTLAITEPLASLLRRLWADRKRPATGLLFVREGGPNRGEPIKPNDYSRYHILRVIKAWNEKAKEPVVWKALYPGRHLGHRAVWDATHDILAVTAVTGNSPIVAMKEYLHTTKEDAIRAQRLVEARQRKKRKR